MAEKDIVEVPFSSIKEDEPVTIYANKKQIREIVKKIGYAIDDEEYIVFKDSNERVLASDEQELKLKDIGLILPANSPHVFVKNNLGSLTKFLAEKE